MSNLQNNCLTAQCRAGNRTYFFDLKKAINGAKYLKITESKAQTEGFERHHIMIFEEDLSTFRETLINICEQLASPKSTNKYITEVRKKTPAAYQKWTKDEEDYLILLHAEGLSIPQISTEMGRQVGGIRSRLKKLDIL